MFTLAIIALVVMSAVRLVIAVATREVPARWLVAAPLWAAVVAGAVMATGCVSADDGPEIDAGEEPDASGPDVDALPPDAAPDAGPDAAPEPFIELSLTFGPDGPDAYAQVVFSVNCPEGSPAGAYDGAIELFVDGAVFDIHTFEWTCDFSWSSSTWFNIPCGSDVWARAVAINPVTGEPEATVTEPKTTCE